MPVCSGQGDGYSGHCCWVDGAVCEFLVTRKGQPRCGLALKAGTFDGLDRNPKWQAAPIGQWFARDFPGYHCGDWPDKIDPPPPGGWCCYEELNPRNTVTVPLPGG